jgi:hypothetical protein
MKRAAIAMLLFAVLRAEGQQNLGYWTAYALKSVTHYRQQIERGEPIRVLAIHRGAPIRKPQLDDPDLEVVDILGADDPTTRLDLFDRLAAKFSATPFECIVISGLQAHEVIKVEQFVRRQMRGPNRIAIVATTTNVRSAPLAVVGNNTFARLQALKAFRLLDGSPQVAPKMIIDNSPVLPERRAWVRCIAKTPRDEQTVSDADVCYRNAIGKKDTQKAVEWEEAIEDLGVALMIDGQEAIDKRVFKRGWGLERYFPRLALADFLSRLGDCHSVHREFEDPQSKSVAEMRAEIYARCPPPPTTHESLLFLDPLLRAIPPELRIAGAANHDLSRGVDGQSQLLPPFAPPIAWSDIALY